MYATLSGPRIMVHLSLLTRVQHTALSFTRMLGQSAGLWLSADSPGVAWVVSAAAPCPPPTETVSASFSARYPKHSRLRVDARMTQAQLAAQAGVHSPPGKAGRS